MALNIELADYRTASRLACGPRREILQNFGRSTATAACSPTAPADGDLDVLLHEVVAAVGLDQGIHIGALGQLHPGADERAGAFGDVEYAGEHVRVLLDQDGDGLGL